MLCRKKKEKRRKIWKIGNISSSYGACRWISNKILINFQFLPFFFSPFAPLLVSFWNTIVLFWIFLFYRMYIHYVVENWSNIFMWGKFNWIEMWKHMWHDVNIISTYIPSHSTKLSAIVISSMSILNFFLSLSFIVK